MTQIRVRGAALVSVLIAVLSLAGCGGGGSDDEPPATTLRMAAASHLQYALVEIVDGFTRTHPHLRVEVSYGSSGGLFQQLANGAPYDLYLAADVAYPRRLTRQGLAEPAALFRYATGRLVVWAGAGSPVDVARGVDAVRDADRVAIANPAHAPYGRAAQAALRAAGVYEQVTDRLVRGDSVAQAAEFVSSGNADVGIVAMAQVRAPPLREVGRWQEVPAGLFPELAQAGVVLTGATTGAGQLRDYLTGPDGAEVLRRYGFGEPTR